MASFMQKMRNNPDYRLRVILLVILGVLVYGSLGTDKKTVQAFETCHAHNGILAISTTPWTYGGQNYYKGLTFDQDKEVCLGQLCMVGRVPQWGPDQKYCAPSIDNGFYIMKSLSSDGCTSKCSTSIDDEWLLCRACEPDEEPQTCNAAEKAIADIVKQMFPSLSCKTAYYTAIFGGGFAVLLLFAIM